ncbi:MAG: HAMP domain-containing histidine kinase [Cyanosarcina radialis HA8281-LM2]|jgi:signal transduction histidine kinase|nr:HAMP domain-containing histidine kinase [Cyanosarcina radialis HA8281-LM2]
MNQNKLFYFNRLRLALWYTAVMSLILALCGLAVYRAMSGAYWQALDRELNSVAGTLHDSIELKLKQPGKLEPIIQQLLPEICLVGSSCPIDNSSSHRHILGAINEAYYYVRFFDNSGRLVATTASDPQGKSPVFNSETWQTIKDDRGNLYHQVSLVLHTQNNLNWGYIQIGRSFQDLDTHLGHLRLILWLGLPLAILLIAASSWWLAGLAMQPIYQSYRQIQQFTADVAHELRTPLAASQATVESALMISVLDENEARDILKTLERQNLRLSQLVADLLLLARLERQAIPLRYQSIALNDLLSDLVEELAALAINSDITLNLEVRVDRPLIVEGDEEQLYRLVSNLIVNGIQYTPAGGTVTAILKRHETQAAIEIRDTGIGIAPTEQKRIFDRFYRVHSDRSRHTGGSGLGLSIAQAIARSHHGSLEVNSIPDRGSTFTVRLPLKATNKLKSI